jgi:ketosteroid isomerase-like protein
MSRNIETVNTYLDGFSKNDHAQILSCLTDDIEWTVFGAFHLTGKRDYDKAIDGAPEFIDPPELEVVRMVEQGDIVMAELTGTAKRTAGGEMRMSMAEVFVMRDGKIAERRAWVIVLKKTTTADLLLAETLRGRDFCVARRRNAQASQSPAQSASSDA